MSLLPVAADEGREHPPVLIEILEGRAFAAIRTPRFVRAEYQERGGAELYDLKRDPHQLENLHGAPRYRSIERRLSRRLDRLKGCAGGSCR